MAYNIKLMTIPYNEHKKFNKIHDQNQKSAVLLIMPHHSMSHLTTDFAAYGA